jgi:SAM-dependent methyltransferase
MTKRLLGDAGVGAGMRVIDVGCGGGDVSFLIARLVGEEGQVLGVDRDPRPLTTARGRAGEMGLSNITFAEGDFCELSPEYGQFDAAVGRRVLMYQRDAVGAVRRLSRILRPGALVIFQEHDSVMTPGRLMSLPLHERAHEWIWRTVELEGANIHMGFDLPSVLSQAGLTLEHVRAEAIVQTPETRYPVGAIVRAMLHRIVQQGVATEEEVDVDTLDRRLIEERVEANATYIGDMVFGAWARKSG